MKIAIIGFGLEGRAAYDYWQAGNEITICDQNPELQLPDGVAGRLGDGYLSGLDEFDVIVRSPFVHPRQIVEGNSPDILLKVTSNTNEFLRVCNTRNIIGVTGTKGKGTTSTLITKLLQAAGKTVHLGGNIGVPALDLLKNGIAVDDWVVLELSSYQLIDLKKSPHIAACLMVVPEHLDWHEDMEEYLAAKQQLFIHQEEDDIAIYYPKSENSVSIADASLGQQIPYFEAPGAYVTDGIVTIDGHELCHVDELKLLGQHNWQNVCAAVTVVWQITDDVEAIHAVLASFTGLPHPIEKVRELEGVTFYNDSFATGLGATQAAIMAVEEPKVVILGGYDRMLDLSGFAKFAADHADRFRKILVIGASGERLAEALSSAGFENYSLNQEVKTMPAIVDAARALAQSGDAIVLSPGFASFDMFKNFEDRGNQFRDVVNSL